MVDWGRMQIDTEEDPLPEVAALGRLGDDCASENCAGQHGCHVQINVACHVQREVDGEGTDGPCGNSAVCEVSERKALYDLSWRCWSHESMSY